MKNLEHRPVQRRLTQSQQRDFQFKCQEIQYWIQTGSAEAGTGGEFGNVDNFYSKLLIRLSMYASAYNGEWSSEKLKKEEIWDSQTEMIKS